VLSRHQGRRLAVQALYSYEAAKTRLDQLLEFPWYEGDESLDFPRLLVSGTIQELAAIDREITRRLEHWDIDRVSRVDLAILRVGTYALIYQNDIPAQVTIDEAVELAKELSTTESYRFVNGVLDAIRRDYGRNEETG
jgi:N utilization substance protein B